MIVYSLLIFTLLFALMCVSLAWRGATSGLRRGWHRLLMACTGAIFIYLYGAWVFLSVYTRYVFAACVVLALIAGLRRARENAGDRKHNIRAAVNVLFAGLFAALTVLYYTGTTGTPYGVAALSFPFRSGTYYVFQGGKGLPTNIFHYGLRGAVYAMDIVKLNDKGNRASRIFSTRLNDYEIYGDTLYSPCNGVVQGTATDNPDNIPPNRKRGPTNTNHVLIATASYYVFMGHLKEGCVFVHEGDSVQAGQPLGCAGNSGFSLEPHLHIQVHARTNSGLPWYKEKPLLIAFNGRSYLLFEEITAGRK